MVTTVMAITNDYEYNQWDDCWRAQSLKLYGNYLNKIVAPTCMLYPDLPRADKLRKYDIQVILVLDKQGSVVGVMMYREHLIHHHEGVYEIFCMEVDKSIKDKSHTCGEMLRAARALEPGIRLLVTCGVSDKEMVKFAKDSKATRMNMEQFLF